jgi:hypothetical protein
LLDSGRTTIAAGTKGTEILDSHRPMTAGLEDFGHEKDGDEPQRTQKSRLNEQRANKMMNEVRRGNMGTTA